VESAITGQPLNGGNFGAIRLNCQGSARFDRHPIHVDGASAALAGITADVGAGQTQAIAQEVD
jgi:hypothetical protein